MRLAYERGLLTNSSLNWCQLWAAMYHMSVKRWFMAEVRDDFLRRFTIINNPKRYFEYFAPDLGQVVDAAGDPDEMPISPEEFDSIESFLDSIDKKRVLSGGAVQSEEEGWQ